MAGFKLDFFKGLRPRITATKLGLGEAQTAQNVLLGSGDLEPIPDKATTQSTVIEPGTIYRYKDDSGNLWFEWIARVNVAQGPIKNDSYNRVYYTGALQGDGKPKFTTNELADGGGGGPYPEGWQYIGVPAPTSPLTASVVQLPEDVDPGLRQANQFFTDTFEIDQILYKEYPGAGNDDEYWQLDTSASPEGGILFDLLPGTAFRIKSVINNSRVTLESATEPGITMRTINSDKTTVFDWDPFVYNSSTRTADFVGWRIPAGMQVTIPDHKLAVGDIIVCSATNFAPIYFPPDTQNFYEDDWAVDSSHYLGGLTVWDVRDASISASATPGDTPFFMLGSFYYDVDRASSEVSELEDRTYVYTYVNSYGEEGPPSDPSEVTPQLDGKDVTLTNIAMPPTIGYDITNIRIYRSNSTEAGTEYQFVKEIGLSVSTTDSVLSEDLGEVIPSTSWDPPPSGMKGIVDMPNGMMVGYSGKTVHFAEPYFPHAYPPEYDQAIAFDIVGTAAFGTSVAVLTTGWPYIVTGTHPRNASVRPVKVNYACSSAESIATDGDNVYYAAEEGLVELGARGARLVTETFADKSDWSAYSPSTMVGTFYDGRYHGFWGFDASAVETEIVAEVSGTVTDADESDIRDGSKTIILTLTNDLWVTAGTSFDNQRQNIIDGISDTAASPQTNGWDNILRDTNLSVTDVVRTSDTVVTITLPASPTYSIDSAETIQPTIPAAALQVSNAAVVTGSTFKIEWERAASSVAITGTIDGAAEADIVTGGDTVILTLTNDTWISVADGFNTYRATLALGLKASTNEIFGWNDTVPHEILVASVVRTSDTVVTITLPAIADYAVTDNESITAEVPYQILETQEDVNVTSGNSVGILATGEPSALFSGTATDSMTENEVIAGAKVLDITLTNETFVAAGTGPIGTTAQSEALLAAITATADPTAGWNAQVRDNFVVGDLTRVSSTVARVTLGAEASYAIDGDETIGCIIPSGVLTGGVALAVSNSFSVTNQNPVTCVLSGTVDVTPNIQEDDIVDGGKTIILTLSQDTWLAAGTGPIGSTANTQAIINGIDSAQAEGTGWDAVVKAGLTPATDVVRTSDTVCTITLPAEATYDITAQETITATIPAAALNISAAAVVASPTFEVDVDVPASCAVTGTADGAADTDIIAGGKTILLTISDDEWVAAGTTFDNQRQNIIDGLDAASSPAGGWNTQVRDVMGVSTVVRTSDTLVTITLPATAAYDINAAEVITVTVPASALEQSSIAVTGDVTVDVSATTSSTSKLVFTYSDTSSSDDFIQQTHYDIAYQYTAVESFGGATGGETAHKGAYSASLDRWVFWVGDVFGFDSLYTIEGDAYGTATARTSSMASQDSVGQVFRSDALGYFLNRSRAGLEYSVNGQTGWTDITSAAENPLTAGGSPTWDLYNASGYARHDILYGGADYLYAVIRNYDHNVLVRSADMSGANTPATNWTHELTTPFTTTNDLYAAYGSGNGRIIMWGADTVDGNAQNQGIAYMSHGGTTLLQCTNLSSTPSFGSTAADMPLWIVYGNGKWVAMNTDGEIATVAGGSETDASNWTKGTTISIGTDHIVRSMWYDDGSGGDDGHGFVMVATKFLTGEFEVWTSTNGTSWTKEVDGTDKRSIRAFTKYIQDGSDLA
jgi:hypothetical protein